MRRGEFDAMAKATEFANLKDVLTRVTIHPQRLTSQLTSRGWLETFGRWHHPSVKKPR